MLEREQSTVVLEASIPGLVRVQVQSSVVQLEREQSSVVELELVLERNSAVLQVQVLVQSIPVVEASIRCWELVLVQSSAVQLEREQSIAEREREPNSVALERERVQNSHRCGIPE